MENQRCFDFKSPATFPLFHLADHLGAVAGDFYQRKGQQKQC